MFCFRTLSYTKLKEKQKSDRRTKMKKKPRVLCLGFDVWRAILTNNGKPPGITNTSNSEIFHWLYAYSILKNVGLFYFILFCKHYSLTWLQEFELRKQFLFLLCFLFLLYYYNFLLKYENKALSTPHLEYLLVLHNPN